LHVLLYPALVQGDAAAAEVAAGILHFNRTREVDVIVIARGGGSLEDLAPFNSEFLARAIANSTLPVVSAVGHETDFTIADFVADLRAPTPSAAAELITTAQHRIEEQVEELSLRLHRAVRYALIQARERFGRLSVPAALARLQDGLNRRQQRVDELGYRMEALLRRQVQTAGQRVQHVSASLIRHDVRHRLKLSAERLDSLTGRLIHAQTAAATMHGARLLALKRNLNSLSPLGVLARGYALVYDEEGKLLRNASHTQAGRLLTTRLAQGSVQSRVTQTSQEQTTE
jgi:exodeoxyribonuclease VII large subunit